MYSSKKGASRGAGILSALKATEMMDSKSKLSTEMLVAILDYLPVADQMRVARASRRLQEIVYDDTRWVSRLKSMGCWDEREARRRFEESVRRRRREAEQAARQANGSASRHSEAVATLFDASVEERRSRAAPELRDNFETMSLGGGGKASGSGSGWDLPRDADPYLDVFSKVKSIRGGARQEYGKIYGALAPLYMDMVRAKSHTEPIVVKAFRDPERQAQMLANLRRFARSDWSPGCLEREHKLASMMGIFESAVVREFEQGHELGDVDGRMRRYAHVLHTLNGTRGGIKLFIQKHPIFSDHDFVANPVECIGEGTSADEISLEPSRRFFELLLAKVNEQAGVVERIFPEPAAVFWDFVDKVREDIIMEYATPLFDECHERSIAGYLKAVSGVFEQTLCFFQTLTPPRGPEGEENQEGQKEEEEDVMERAKEMALRVVGSHVDLYLQEELESFSKRAELEVSRWEKKLSEQDSSLESFYMSNINRSADKKDFLSSFKKVVMMPVTALPSFPMGSSFATTATAKPPGRAAALPGGGKALTDELTAKAVIMASKLEGIKSLCSIEVALNLVHKAKTSLGRAAVLIPLGGQVGGETREQCANMFVALLRTLGQRHVKPGFDTAVDHLSHYNPRDVSDHDGHKGVAPLVTFVELVNVGDLISQMVDVFYEQQLAAPGIADKNDFLDPAGLAKKRFEQMLDESVAAGLNKGIDALMDEVEYLHATLQLPTDYNPPAAASSLAVSLPAGLGSGSGAASEPDIGPTPTARRIVELVSAHTSMLVDTTDKAMLDVFNGEVGVRLFAAICKHLKRQRVSTAGAVKLIADMNLYADYVRRLRNPDLLAYFAAVRELSQIFLIDAADARDMAAVIADADRFGGVFRAEEVYEYAQRRADWYQVRRSVERAMYGMVCLVM